MKIGKFETVDRCLILKGKDKEKILVVGDLHLGYEEMLHEQGVSFPMRQMKESLEIFGRMFEKAGKVDKIVLLGDVKHYFGGVLRDESNDFLNLVEFFKKNMNVGGKIIITKGNHDNILEPIVKNYDFVHLVDFFVIYGILFFHGSKEDFEKMGLNIYDSKIKTIVVGHFHPALIVSEDSKKEKFKCFLAGEVDRYKKNFIFVPSFFPLVEGSDILTEIDFGFDISALEVYVLSGKFGEVLDFGKVGKLIT